MTSKRNYIDSKNALVLTGGGARAAYQVGVLSAITKFVPRNHGTPFPILCGTSAGAINSTALACYASCFHLGVKKLEWVWKNLDTGKIYHNDAKGIFGYIGKGILSTFQDVKTKKSSHSLLNNAPLRDLLNLVIDFKRIDDNILGGYLSAVSVTASSYSTGDSISFFQAHNDISPWNRAKRRGITSKINSEHLMASSAIPLVFPSIKIKDRYFGDGSVHQLSPLSTAIHLGAERIFIIGVEETKLPLPSQGYDHNPPSTATIAGHLLDSIFTDTMYSDLERMHRINSILKSIPEKNQQNKNLKHIESLIINPSRDLNEIARNYFYDLPLSVRILLRSIGIKSDSESSIISYLLFEQNFCNEIIKLGFSDAMNKKNEIKLFLNL